MSSPHSVLSRRLGFLVLVVAVVATAVTTLTSMGRPGLLQHFPLARDRPIGPMPWSGAATGRVDGMISPDADHPALDRLDPALLAAVRHAAIEAERDGIDLRITSGWRSKEYQQHLFDAAIQKYGSRDEALRWVQTPDGSSHTAGDAVDVGATDAAYWLSQHGGELGLCQTYANEIWHYELTPDPEEGCPQPR